MKQTDDTYMVFPKTYGRQKLNALYREIPLKDTTFRTLRKYFRAMANLYGIIPLKKAYEIIHSQCPRLVTEKEFLAFAKIARHECENFYILGEDEIYTDGQKQPLLQREIIHSFYFDEAQEDEDLYTSLKRAQQGKEYYIPEKEELLRYENDYYREKTPQLEALENFLSRKLKMSERDIFFAFWEFDHRIRFSTSSPSDGFSDIEEIPFKTMKDKDLDTLLSLYDAYSNHSRMHYNRGYTPEELVSMVPPEERVPKSLSFGPNIQKLIASGEWDKEEFMKMLRSMGMPVDAVAAIPVTGKGTATPEPAPIVPLPVKVGRNDPCPCGSGKKYKNCCGKNR